MKPILPSPDDINSANLAFILTEINQGTVCANLTSWIGSESSTLSEKRNLFYQWPDEIKSAHLALIVTGEN